MVRAWLVVGLAGVVLLLGGPAVAQSEEPEVSSSVSVERLPGEDRYDTARLVAVARFPGGADSAVIVNGTRPLDGLVATAMLATRDAPILYVERDRVPTVTAAALEELGVRQVVVVGGEDVVATSVEDALATGGREVRRIAGATRHDTALAFAREIPTPIVDARPSAIIVDADFEGRDAAVGALSAARGVPVLYVQDGTVPAQTGTFIRERGITQVYVVGGARVVGDDVVDQLEDLMDESGNDTGVVDEIVATTVVGFDANLYLHVADLLSHAPSPVETLVSTYAAPDVITAATLQVPLVMVDRTVSFDTRYILGLRNAEVTELRVIGGEHALSSDRIGAAVAAAHRSDVDGVTGIQELGLTHLEDGQLRTTARTSESRYVVDGDEVDKFEFDQHLGQVGLPFGERVTLDASEDLFTLTHGTEVVATINVRQVVENGDILDDLVDIRMEDERLAAGSSLFFAQSTEPEGERLPTQYRLQGEADDEPRQVDVSGVEAALEDVVVRDPLCSASDQFELRLVAEPDAFVVELVLVPFTVACAGEVS